MSGPKYDSHKKGKRNGSRPRPEKNGFGLQLMTALNPSTSSEDGELELLERRIESLKKDSDAAFDLNTPEGHAKGIRLRDERISLICKREMLSDRQKKKVKVKDLIDLRQEGYVLAPT